MTGQVVASRVRSTNRVELARLALMALQYRGEFGAVLRARRDELDLTQAQVAERVGDWLVEHGYRDAGDPFNVQNISRWERGANLGKVENQEAVAFALETTLADLVARIKPEGAAKTNGDTPDLMGAVNGKPADDDLHARLQRIEDNQRLLLEYFQIEVTPDGHPQVTYGDAYGAAAKRQEPGEHGETGDAT